MDNKKKILFLCVHNSARSQMAEAYLNTLAGDRFNAVSAGIETRPLNPLAIQVMMEVGIDISGNRSKNLFEMYDAKHIFNRIISVCDKLNDQRCYNYPGYAERIQWDLPDPAGFTGTEEEKLEKARKLREDIRARVIEFAGSEQT